MASVVSHIAGSARKEVRRKGIKQDTPGFEIAQIDIDVYGGQTLNRDGITRNVVNQRTIPMVAGGFVLLKGLDRKASGTVYVHLGNYHVGVSCESARNGQRIGAGFRNGGVARKRQITDLGSGEHGK